MKKFYQDGKWQEYEAHGKIYFKNNAQIYLWEDYILGQISDGYWGDDSDTDWRFWYGLQPEIGEFLSWTSYENLNGRRIYDLFILEDYNVEDMIKIGNLGKYNLNEDQRKMINRLIFPNSPKIFKDQFTDMDGDILPDAEELAKEASQIYRSILDIFGTKDNAINALFELNYNNLTQDLSDISEAMSTEVPFKTGSVDKPENNKLRAMIKKCKNHKLIVNGEAFKCNSPVFLAYVNFLIKAGELDINNIKLTGDLKIENNQIVSKKIFQSLEDFKWIH